MKIGITNDHRGFKMKEILTNYLELMGYTIIDYGSSNEASCDFPDYAYKLGKGILNDEVDCGIAICGTGIGMSIALNKMRGIYCAKVNSAAEATLAKAHNDANVIALSEEVPEEIAKEIVSRFIDTPFSNINKYVRRNDKIKEIENE